jgi:hypothetical protein
LNGRSVTFKVKVAGSGCDQTDERTIAARFQSLDVTCSEYKVVAAASRVGGTRAIEPGNTIGSDPEDSVAVSVGWPETLNSKEVPVVEGELLRVRIEFSLLTLEFKLLRVLLLFLLNLRAHLRDHDAIRE